MIDAHQRVTDDQGRPAMGTRLMLIDGHALVHRAFHAIDGLTTSGGELINAVFGFSSMLLKAIQTFRPTHIIMALDRPTPTFRHQQFAEYKATRPTTPQPLVSQFKRVRQVAEALNIPLYELDGYEADDLLGTLSAQAEQQARRSPCRPAPDRWSEKSRTRGQRRNRCRSARGRVQCARSPSPSPAC